MNCGLVALSWGFDGLCQLLSLWTDVIRASMFIPFLQLFNAWDMKAHRMVNCGRSESELRENSFVVPCRSFQLHKVTQVHTSASFDYRMKVSGHSWLTVKNFLSWVRFICSVTRFEKRWISVWVKFSTCGRNEISASSGEWRWMVRKHKMFFNHNYLV